MKIQPQNQRVLIVPIDDSIDEVIIKNAGSTIEIPDSAKPHYARVIAVAENCTLKLKPGDKLILIPRCNVCIIDPHQGHGLIHESNILAIFVEDENPILN